MRTTNDVIFTGRVDTEKANSLTFTATDAVSNNIGKAIPTSPRALKMQTSPGFSHSHGVSFPRSPRSPRSVGSFTVIDSHPATSSSTSAADMTVNTPPRTHALTDSQLRALFDILTHHDTYEEFRYLRYPDAVGKCGYPFVRDGRDAKSGMPLLQSLLTTIILPMPGARDFPPAFWSDTVAGLLRKFGEAVLSEAYDKGALGTRKTFATAACAVQESLTRGILGRVPAPIGKDRQYKQDPKTASGLTAAWNWCAQELVYGNLVDELFDHAAKTPNIDGLSPGFAAVVDYIIIHMATFLHHIFVLSPEGQYVLKLAESVHRLIPYSMVAQTLRIGNAATMLNGMMKIFLAKMSVGGLTNWIGITKNADDGMNLMQRIISMVLGYDASDFRKIADKIKKGKPKDTSNVDRLAAIDEHLQSSQKNKDVIRERSIKEEESIIITILKEKSPKLASNLTDEQHTQCLEYHSAMLSVRDREKLIEALCCSKPDFLTTAVRGAVATFEPMIRNIHDHVNLRKYVGLMQSFLDDFIQTSKPKVTGKGNETKIIPPSVEDYVELLRRNRLWFYEFMHEIASGCPDLAKQFRVWVKRTVTEHYQRDAAGTESTQHESEQSQPFWSGAGDRNRDLQAMFKKLPATTQESVLSTLDLHDRYLVTLEDVSNTRMQGILDRLNGRGSGGSMSGPGIYLARWQSLMDETLITPATKRSSPPRTGKDVKHSHGLGKKVALSAKEQQHTWDAGALAIEQERSIPDAPDARVVVEALGPAFRDLAAEIGLRGLKKALA